jgi:predicted metal-binding protein
MTEDTIMKLAEGCGFEKVAPLDVKSLRFLPEVRQMCAADKCHSYNKSWSCPPATGELEELQARCAGFTHGILVQTVGHREDAFDYTSIEETSRRHDRRFRRLAARLEKNLPAVWPMGIGACRRCKTCTWPDAPCRHPKSVYPPMEACGLLVSEVCSKNGVPYYYGEDSISFTSCYLFNL